MSKLKYYDGTDWKVVNGQVTGDTLPIGAIVPFGGWDAPTGWLICDGTLLNKTAYPELFNAIGYSFGGEEGGSTFGLPDLRGRVPVGLKETDTDFDGMGLTGGSKAMQQHYHEGAYSTNGDELTVYGGSGSTQIIDLQSGYSASGSVNAKIKTANAGTGNSGNLQPYQTVNYIIKATQSAGLVANVSNIQSESTTDTYSCDYINGIIESGSNANGYYTKYADGTLICRYYIGPVDTNQGAGATKAVTFPYEFVDTYWQVSLTMTNGQAYWSQVASSISDKAKTGFNFKSWNDGGGNNTGQYWDYVAIGKWK